MVLGVRWYAHSGVPVRVGSRNRISRSSRRVVILHVVGRRHSRYLFVVRRHGRMIERLQIVVQWEVRLVHGGNRIVRRIHGWIVWILRSLVLRSLTLRIRARVHVLVL